MLAFSLVGPFMLNRITEVRWSGEMVTCRGMAMCCQLMWMGS
jgi:hypothetical protein